MDNLLESSRHNRGDQPTFSAQVSKCLIVDDDPVMARQHQEVFFTSLVNSSRVTFRPLSRPLSPLCSHYAL
jgi:hypothetical protein